MVQKNGFFSLFNGNMNKPCGNQTNMTFRSFFLRKEMVEKTGLLLQKKLQKSS